MLVAHLMLKKIGNSQQWTGATQRRRPLELQPNGLFPGNWNKRPNGSGSLVRNIISTILIFLILSSIYSLILGNQSTVQTIPISQLAGDIISGGVKTVTVTGDNLDVVYTNGADKQSQKEAGVALTQTLVDYGVTPAELAKVSINVGNDRGIGFWLLNFGPTIISILFVLFFVWFLSRQVKGAGMQAFTFGQSKARITAPDDKKQRVTLKDVAGAKEAKQELSEIVDFLKSPKKFLENWCSHT